ncbi:MAG: hypothetical protein WAN14_04640 [Candidatus Acidiferrales bacterium]
MSSDVDPATYAQATTEMEKLEAKTVAYYNNLTAAQMAEQSDWGRVGGAWLSQVGASRRF